MFFAFPARPAGGGPAPRTRQAAFTLTEVLIVLALAAALLGLLFPSFSAGLRKARLSQCTAKLRQIYTGAQLYSAEHDGLVLPSSQTAENGDITHWVVLVTPYLGGDKKTTDEMMACPRWHADTPTIWHWGYALNETPGYEGSASTPHQKATTRFQPGSTKTPFRMAAITHPSRRLLACDGIAWHIGGSRPEDKAASDRHGPGACNAVFFDGHAEVLKPEQVNQAVYDPAGAPE